MIDPNQLERRWGHLSAALAGATPGAVSPALLTSAMAFAKDALDAGRSDLGVQALEQLVARAPRHAPSWQLLGFGYGHAQRIPEAAVAFDRAATLRPDDVQSALARAQAHLDAGFAAVELFKSALLLDPDNLAGIGGWAAALAAQGDRTAAESVLSETLLRHPAWVAGHHRLAALRFASGDSRHFARSYVDACAAHPRNLPLRLAWFAAIAQTHDWETALAIIADGEKLIGPSAAFLSARTFVASESGNRALAEQLFAQTMTIRDDVLGIAHIRHCLRTAQLEKAERLALDLVKGPSAAMIWPYLSLIWRLRGDARAAWLDGSPPHIRVFDLGYSAAELERLVAVLRLLHTAPAPYLEQSVRGGTQTDTERQLFFRAEPEIQQVRDKVCAAIREYLDGLPPHVPGHPLLGLARGPIRFSGSWSVRLQAQGFHASHTHPRGWISSALYISLPTPEQLGPAPAGWIRFGCAPPTLDVNLPAYGQIEPKPGRLVLFPSTLWHATLPFHDGERLVIAFDVMPPRAPIRFESVREQIIE